MEHNQEQITKALGMCIAPRPKCKECPYFIGDVRCKHSKLLKDALTLIKELTEENERLHASCTELERNCASLNDENERLKADTVRRMQERIKKRCIEGGIYPAFVENVIDQVAKEMLEDSNAHQMEQTE